MIFGRQPALILGMIQAGIGLLIGLNVIVLSGDQVGLIMAFAAAVAAVWTAQVVTPTSDPRLKVGTEVNGGTAVVTGKAPAPTTDAP